MLHSLTPQPCCILLYLNQSIWILLCELSLTLDGGDRFHCLSACNPSRLWCILQNVCAHPQQCCLDSTQACAASLSLTKRDLWKCFLPAPLSAVHGAHSCQPSMSECMQIYACNMFMSPLQHVSLFPCSRKQLNPHHHYLHHTPPPFPMGLCTQINWKKEECPVVLPLHLSGRESRRGSTHGPCRGTISLHLSQTVSSLMGWNIASTYIIDAY